MARGTKEIFGYSFCCDDIDSIEVDHLLLWAPLKADGGRSHDALARDAARAVGWELMKPNSKSDKKRIAHALAKRLDALLSDIDQAVSRSVEAVLRSDLASATQLLEPYRDLWVGLYPIDEAEQVIASIREYQHEHALADGYDGVLLTPRVAKLHIWLD